MDAERGREKAAKPWPHERIMPNRRNDIEPKGHMPT
jgi:hypothetical protein